MPNLDEIGARHEIRDDFGISVRATIVIIGNQRASDCQGRRAP